MKRVLEKSKIGNKNSKTEKVQNKKEKREKSIHGITLVSLVVTIVVLIILAGISLNLTLGENGLFTMAKKAKENIELAQIEEQTRMNELYDELEQGGYYESPEIGELEGTIDDLNETIKNLEEQLESEKQAKQGLQDNIQELNGQISTLQGQVNQQKTEIEEKQTRINELTSQVEEDKTNIAEKEKQIEDLNRQVAQGETNLQAKQEQIDELTKQVAQKQADIQNKEEQINGLKSEKSELEQQVAANEATIQEKQSQINSLNEQIKTKDTQIANQEQQITQLNSSKTQLETQVNSLKTQLAQSQKELKDLKEKEVSVNMVNVGDATIPVPKGFYYVGGTKASGVVISDDARDENKYANQTDVPAGVTYNTNGTVNTESSALKGNQFVWIPVELNNYKKTKWTKDDGTEFLEAAGTATWEKQTSGLELTQIKKYGGFYIGRYEAGTSQITLSTNVDFGAGHITTDSKDDNFSIRDGLGHTVTKGKITCKAGEIPYYHADYFTALELCNSMYNNSNYVQSGLITGTMWDTMLNFIAENNRDITESYWGNYTNNDKVKYTTGQGRFSLVTLNGNNTGSNEAFTKADNQYHLAIRTTASTENAKKKNLYDIAGNLWEWTQEVACLNSGTVSYMFRGGSFDCIYSTRPTCYRAFNVSNGSYINLGFRPVLYIR